MFNCSHNRGFTLPELIISMAVLLSIFAYSGINLLRIIPNADLTEVSNSFMADSKSQQNSAMLGEGNVVSLSNYSIKIEETRYILFRGESYVDGSVGNYAVTYPNGITTNTDFVNGQIIFTAISGEIKDFDENANRVVFNGPNGSHVTIRFNKLGNVYYVNKI